MIEQDIIHFISIELIYLIVFLLFIFTKINLFNWLAFVIAGIKYSVSALDSIDIITYNQVYNTITKTGVDTHGMESGFLALLYISKQIYLPVTLIHLLSIIFFLLSINFLLSAFVSKQTASIVALYFGFFAAGGELCSYLIRQLLSTSTVFVSIGFLIRQKKKIAFALFFPSFLFHSSPIFFIPVFVTSFLNTKKAKIIAITLMIVLITVAVSNFELGAFLILKLGGENSLYYSKYKYYNSFEGFRNENRSGIFALIMLIYFLSTFIFNFVKSRKSDKKLLYICTIIITMFSFYLEFILQVYWLSTRISFISRLLIFTSNIFLTTEIIRNKKLVMSGIAIVVFIASCVSIVNGYQANGIYRLPYGY